MIRLLPVLLLAACAVSTPPEDPVEDAVFPHGEAYALRSGHGLDVQRFGPGACLGCHGEGEDAIAAPCATCHEGSYPHAPGIRANHGLRLDDSCDGCHAGPGWTAEVAGCDSCHASYPHPSGWEQAHGPEARARADAVASCGTCHGPSLGGTARAPSCTSCHTTYPHPSTWDRDHRREDPATCTSCHGELGAGGSSGVACAQCHPTFPHPADWRAEHLRAVPHGEGACLDCHAAGDGPVLPARSCAATCHGAPGGER